MTGTTRSTACSTASARTNITLSEALDLMKDTAVAESFLMVDHVSKTLLDCLAKELPGKFSYDPNEDNCLVIGSTKLSMGKVVQMVKAFNKLDDIIEVKSGKITSYSRSELHFLGPGKAFWLFPNLPTELRQAVYKIVSYDGLVQMRGVEVLKQKSAGAGRTQWIHRLEVEGYSPSRSVLKLVNKDAHDYIALTMKKIFNPKRVGHVVYALPNPLHEEINLLLASDLLEPKIGIAAMMTDITCMDFVTKLTIEVSNLQSGLAFIENNIFTNFKNLKSAVLKVGITTNLPAALSVPVTFIPVLFKDGTGKHFEYSTVTELNGQKHHNTSGILIPFTKYEHDEQALMDLVMLLGRTIRQMEAVPWKLEMVVALKPEFDNPNEN